MFAATIFALPFYVMSPLLHHYYLTILPFWVLKEIHYTIMYIQYIKLRYMNTIKLHYSFKNKSDPHYCCSCCFLVLPAGDRLEGGAAVCSSRFPLYLLTRCGSIPASKVAIDAAHVFKRMKSFFSLLCAAGCCRSGNGCAGSGRSPAAVAAAGNVCHRLACRGIEADVTLKGWFNVYSWLAAWFTLLCGAQSVSMRGTLF